jgi:hypothetical protein
MILQMSIKDPISHWILITKTPLPMPIPKRQQSARFPFQRLGEAFGVGTQAVSVKEPRVQHVGIARLSSHHML